MSKLLDTFVLKKTAMAVNDAAEQAVLASGFATEAQSSVASTQTNATLAQTKAEEAQQHATSAANALTQMTTKLSALPINLTEYDVFTDGNLDGTKVTNVLNTNNKKTFYLPDGTYYLVNPITITNEVSLTLSKNTVIEPLNAMDDMIVYNLTYSSTIKRKISGGSLNGKGLAKNLLRIASCTNLTVEDMAFSDPINRGILINGGYEFIGKNLFFRNNLTTNITDNIAIYVNTSDCIIDTVVIVNYTVGLQVVQAGNTFLNFHIWGAQQDRLSLSKGVINNSGANLFDKCYFDTCGVGVESNSSTNLKQCIFNVSRTYRKYFATQPVYINQATSWSTTIADSCYFEYSNAEGESYKCTVVSGNINRVIFRNCNIPTPTTLDNVPTNNYEPKIFKVQLTFAGWSAITAGSSAEKEITITGQEFTVDFRDTVIFNINGDLENGLLANPYTRDGIIGLRLNNVSSSSITPTDKIMWVTIIKNADLTYLPYVTQS